MLWRGEGGCAGQRGRDSSSSPLHTYTVRGKTCFSGLICVADFAKRDCVEGAEMLVRGRGMVGAEDFSNAELRGLCGLVFLMLIWIPA